jgi:hypothetical protein
MGFVRCRPLDETATKRFGELLREGRKDRRVDSPNDVGQRFTYTPRIDLPKRVALDLETEPLRGGLDAGISGTRTFDGRQIQAAKRNLGDLSGGGLICKRDRGCEGAQSDESSRSDRGLRAA